jgi:hypothetical protein
MSEMPEDMDRAMAEAYPDRVPDYVRTRVWEAGKNSAARIAELGAEVAKLTAQLALQVSYNPAECLTCKTRRALGGEP